MASKPNHKIVKRYLSKFFSAQYLTERDAEFKSLIRILNKKDNRHIANLIELCTYIVLNTASLREDEITEDMEAEVFATELLDEWLKNN